MLSIRVLSSKWIIIFMASDLEHGDTVFLFLLTFQLH